ncbi:MAG: Tfp pilus assembly protein PilF [Planctomycetota bacterium]|jgi:Tfp pilus assembly protein PilF
MPSQDSTYVPRGFAGPPAWISPRVQQFFIVALALLTYASTLSNGFVFDDVTAVRDNVLLRRGDLSALFTSDYWSGFHGDRSGLYRPLTSLSYAIQLRLLDNDAFYFHLFNMLLHAACAWGLYHFVRRLTRRDALALLSALLFASHSALSESVCAIVGRADLLAAGLSLAALWLHLSATARSTLAAALCLAMALLSKESAIALLALLPLADLFQYRSFSRKCYSRSYLLYSLVLLLYLLWRYHILGALTIGDIDPLDNPLITAPIHLRLFNAIAIFFRYLGLLTLPAHLSADYSYAALPISSELMSPQLLLVAGGLVALATLLYSSFYRLPTVFWGLSWTLLAIAPIANIFLPIGTIMGERLLYLPAMGFCTGMAALLLCLPRWRILLWGLMIVLFAMRTTARSTDWHNDYALFQATTQSQPHSARAWRGFGNAALARDEVALGLSALGRALHIWPEYYEVHSDLAVYYLQAEQPEIARQHLATSLQLRPDYPPAWFNLGLTLYQLEQKTAAHSAFEQALRLDPSYADAAYNLGVIALAQGEPLRASDYFQQTLKINPSHRAARHNLNELNK